MTSNANTSGLAPCPFCGGEAWLNDYEAKYSDLPPMSRAPQCRSCGASLGYLTTPAKATEAWNRRVTAASAQARIAELEAEVAALTKALTGLTCGGSEFFTRKGDRYVADIKACVDWVRRAKTDAHRRSVEAIKRATAAEARADRLARALERIADVLSSEPFDRDAVIPAYEDARAALKQETQP